MRIINPVASYNRLVAAENGCMFLVNEIKYYLGLKDEYGNILYKPDDMLSMSSILLKKYDNKSINILG